MLESHTPPFFENALAQPVVVRGLARHLELRDLARKRTEEQRTREHEAFHVPKAEGWRRGQKFTTPQPFELTS